MGRGEVGGRERGIEVDIIENLKLARMVLLVWIVGVWLGRCKRLL